MLSLLAEVKGRVAVLAITGLATISIGAGVMSFAAFTDDADVTTNGFSTGTVSISTTPSSTLFNVSNIMPGFTSTQALTVANDGSVDVEYTMTTSATNTDTKSLRDQLTLTIKTKDTDTAGCANWNGTQLYDGSLASGAISSARAVAAQASEVLCFRVTLPSNTGNAYQLSLIHI